MLEQKKVIKFILLESLQVMFLKLQPQRLDISILFLLELHLRGFTMLLLLPIQVKNHMKVEIMKYQ